MKSEFHEFLNTCKTESFISFAAIQKFVEFAFHEKVELYKAFCISLVSPKISRVLAIASSFEMALMSVDEST
jgi:hypothetical protein